MTQKAQASDGGNVIQVSGNFHLTQGISLSEFERLFNLLLSENFPKLAAVAAATAKENVDTLSKSTFEKMESRIEQICVEKLAQPDVQHTFNAAVQGAARKGAKIDIDLLSDLLVSRIEKNNNDYLDSCIETAAGLVPMLTSDMVSILPVIHFIQLLKYGNPSDLNRVYGIVYDNYAAHAQSITPSKLRTMASLGLGIYISFAGNNIIETLEKRFRDFDGLEFELQKPRASQLLDFYNQKELYKFELTTSGQVIGSTLLKRVFPSINIIDTVG